MSELFNNTSIVYISGLELSEASFKRKHTIKEQTFEFNSMCLVGPGLFILGSYFPNKLTLFDTTEMKPVTHLNLQQGERPYEVCLIPGGKVAVTCECSNKIVIVSVKNNQLQREHAIHIDREPACIASYKDDLFVVTRNWRTALVSISRVAMTGDRHVVCDLPEGWNWYWSGQYSMITSKESEPKIYVAYYDRRDVLEVSLDGSKLRSISMSHKKGDFWHMNFVSVGKNILYLFSEGKKLILADIKSEKTSVIMKQKTELWRNNYRAFVCPVTQILFIWDKGKRKIKLFKWK